MESPEVELEALQNALLAHLEWQAATGAIGLPPCDSATLQLRRERYREAVRELAVEEDSPNIEAARPGAAEGDSGSSTTSTTSEYGDVPQPTQRSWAAAAESGHVDDGQRGPDAALPTQLIHPTKGPATQPSATLQQPSAALQTTQRAEPAAPSAPARDHRLGDDARHRLHLLRDEVSGCVRCGLHETRTNTVFARGSERSGICFVGEGPGADEDAQGLPFVGAAGQLLDKMIQAMGFERDDVYICNIVKCRPPENRKPQPAEMAACREFLTEQLELLQPKVIVALGATAVTGLLGLNLGITRLRGQWRLYRGQIPVMPTFHPAYLLRQPSAKRQVWDDLKQVLNHLGVDAPPR